MKRETYIADRDAKRAERERRSKLPWDVPTQQRIDPDRPRPVHNRASRRSQLGMVRPRHRNAKAVYRDRGETIRQTIESDPLVVALSIRERLVRFIDRAAKGLVGPSE